MYLSGVQQDGLGRVARLLLRTGVLEDPADGVPEVVAAVAALDEVEGAGAVRRPGREAVAHGRGARHAPHAVVVGHLARAKEKRRYQCKVNGGVLCDLHIPWTG